MIRKIGTIFSMVLLVCAIGLQPTQAQEPKNAVELEDTEFVNGAMGTDTQGAVRSVYDPEVLSVDKNPLFEVDEFGVPTQFETFLLFDGAYLDMEVVANENDFLTGIMLLDKFGAVHTTRLGTTDTFLPGETPTEVPTEVPTATPTPTEPPAPTATPTPAETPIETPTATPIETPTATPVPPEPTATPPAETPTESPTESLVFAPNFFPRQLPEQVPGELTSPDLGPELDFYENISSFNAANPDRTIFLPYFPFNVEIPTALDGVARDIEIAVDWRTATNDFQGYYIMDAYAGIHYVNNAEVLDFLKNFPDLAPNGTYTQGMETFNEIFGFRPQFLLDYAGFENGVVQTKPAPYFFFAGSDGFPIARDLEVIAEFKEMNFDLILKSQQAQQTAIDSGIDTDTLFHDIEISGDRLNPANKVFADKVAVTQGYAILDGFGAVHTMVEDDEGNPIPAPWENFEDGMNEDAPYFFPFDIAVDIEVSPLQNAVILLNRVGEVFTIMGENTSLEDIYVDPSILDDLPIFGFDNARDLSVAKNDEGKIIGLYVLDRFGTIHMSGDIPDLPGEILYLPNGQSRNLELSPYQHPMTAPSIVTAPN